MIKTKLYIAYNTSDIDFMEQALSQIMPRIIEYYDIFIPTVIKNHIGSEVIYSDLKNVNDSDILLCFMRKPGIGAAIELYQHKLNHKPAIGYQCMEHPFLNYLLDDNFDDIRDVIKYLLQFKFLLKEGE